MNLKTLLRNLAHSSSATPSVNDGESAFAETGLSHAHSKFSILSVNATVYCKAILLVTLIVAMACTNTPKNKPHLLTLQIDSLQTELVKKQAWVLALQEIGTLMDSIDANRNLLRINMVEGGAAHKDYVIRMKSIQRYMVDGRKKIDHLEQMLAASNIKKISGAYATLTNQLKSRLVAQDAAIRVLKQQVSDYQIKNHSLAKVILLQKVELSKKEKLVLTKLRELTEIKKREQKLVSQNKWAEGNAYYAQGEAIEEIAKRTKWAARKKRQTYEKALTMYQKALSFGIEKAAKKIEHLQYKYKITPTANTEAPKNLLPSR